MKTELKQIIKELSEVISEEKLNITHSELLDSAIRIYLTNTINKNKTTPLKNESPRDYLENTNGLATPQQIYVLKKAGKTIPDNLSKKEAYLLIKSIKGK
jgi:hypothetical protein